MTAAASIGKILKSVAKENIMQWRNNNIIDWQRYRRNDKLGIKA